MDLDTRLLRVFAAVMRCGSVTRAAEELNTSQPSISKAVQRLESVTGLRLFEPRGRGIHPTREAQLLYEDALRVDREVESVRHRIMQLRQKRERGVRIATIPALATELLPRAIVAFRAERPNVAIEVELWRREKVIAELDVGSIDIALIYSPTEHVPAGFSILAAAPLHCLMPAGHRLAAKALVTPADLAGERLVVYHHSLDMADALWRLLESIEPMPAIAVEASQAGFLRDLVRRGVGISLIDAFTASDPTLSDMIARPFAPELPFYAAVATRGVALPQDGRAFLKILENCVRAPAGPPKY